MDGDRVAALTVRAAVHGVIDFRAARLNDPAWWRRLRILLHGLEQDLDAQVHDAGFRYYLAQVAHGNLTEECFSRMQEQAQAAYYRVINTARPWDKQSSLAQRKKEFINYRQQYIDVVGVDPSDPVFQAWQAQRIAEDEAMSAAAATQTAEAVIAQRAEERARRRNAKR